MSIMPENDLAYTLAGVGRKKDPFEQRRSFAQRLAAQGMDTSPVQSPWQGVGRLAQSLAGAYGMYKADQDEKQATEDRSTKLASTIAKMKTDPEGGLADLAAFDPEIGARTAAQMAVERMKINRQNEGLNQVAGTYGGMSSAPPSGGSQGGGVNSNNIGNVRPVGASSGFQQPATLDDGVRLAVNNVRAYPAKFNNGQPMTLVQIGQRWAPVGDGANDPRQWAMNVASIGGLDPNQPLDMNDPATAAKFAQGVHGAEHGANKAMPVDAYARILTGGSAPGPQVAQGTAATNGTPPTPSPQGVQGPTMVAPPQLPQRMTPRDMPPQLAAPYVDRFRRGGYGRENPAQAEQAMVAHMQRDLDASFENQKLEYQRLQGDFEYNRKRGDDRTGADQKRGDDQTKQKFEFENKLRDDFNNARAAKAYNIAVPLVETAKDAATRTESRAADLNLINAFAKTMDPDSAVMSGERGEVIATASVAERVAAYVGQLNGQAQLSPNTRAKLIQELDSRFNSLKASYDAHEEDYKGIAERNGLNFDNIRIRVRSGQPAGRNDYAANAPTNEELKQKATGGGPRMRISLDGKPL